jgi:hypothetical protein
VGPLTQPKKTKQYQYVRKKLAEERPAKQWRKLLGNNENKFELKILS